MRIYKIFKITDVAGCSSDDTEFWANAYCIKFLKSIHCKSEKSGRKKTPYALGVEGFFRTRPLDITAPRRLMTRNTGMLPQ